MADEENRTREHLATLFLLSLLSRVNKKKRDYSNSFTNFNESTIIITQNLGRQILNRKNSNEEKTYYCVEWIRQASAIYGMDIPGFKYDPDNENSSFYSPKEHRIQLNKKVSLVTLLHEFRHAMQHRGFPMIDEDKEEDARAWSMSLFKKVFPKAHKNAVEKKLVHYY